MKAKNSKERRASFIKFMLLFIAATTFIVIAIFFNFKIPNTENDVLKVKAIRVDRELAFQNDFGKRMVGIDGMLDSLDMKGQLRPYLNDMITRSIGDLQRSVPKKDSITHYEMYDRVVKKYAQIQRLKKELYALSGAKNKIAEYKEALEKSREENRELERDLDILRVSNR